MSCPAERELRPLIHQRALRTRFLILLSTKHVWWFHNPKLQFFFILDYLHLLAFNNRIVSGPRSWHLLSCLPRLSLPVPSPLPTSGAFHPRPWLIARITSTSSRSFAGSTLTVTLQISNLFSTPLVTTSRRASLPQLQFTPAAPPTSPLSLVSRSHRTPSPAF